MIGETAEGEVVGFGLVRLGVRGQGDGVPTTWETRLVPTGILLAGLMRGLTATDGGSRTIGESLVPGRMGESRVCRCELACDVFRFDGEQRRACEGSKKEAF